MFRLSYAYIISKHCISCNVYVCDNGCTLAISRVFTRTFSIVTILFKKLRFGSTCFCSWRRKQVETKDAVMTEHWQ